VVYARSSIPPGPQSAGHCGHPGPGARHQCAGHDLL